MSTAGFLQELSSWIIPFVTIFGNCNRGRSEKKCVFDAYGHSEGEKTRPRAVFYL